jgi:pyruvate dehydrogenase E1 component alpha subunit
MKNLLTKEQLVEFETDIANCFNNSQIKAPVHLYDGNEEQMINIFKNVNSEDWVFCTWRSHYQC